MASSVTVVDISDQVDAVILQNEKDTHHLTETLYEVTDEVLVSFQTTTKSQYDGVMHEPSRYLSSTPNRNKYHKDKEYYNIQNTKKCLKLSMPALMDFDFNTNKVVVAGGCILNALTRSIYPDSDVDIFLYDENTAKSAIAAIVTKITPDSIFSNRNCITMLKDGIKYQIVLRVYQTKAEIIHGFDIGSSSVLYDGEKFFATALGIFALKYHYNIVNLNVRRASYENRLLKYQHRGFGIIMPHIDRKKVYDDVKTHHNFNLAKLNVGIEREQHGKEIKLFTYIIFNNVYDGNHSEYDSNIYAYDNYGKLIFHNFKCLMEGKMDDIYIKLENPTIETAVNFAINDYHADISNWAETYVKFVLKKGVNIKYLQQTIDEDHLEYLSYKTMTDIKKFTTFIENYLNHFMKINKLTTIECKFNLTYTKNSYPHLCQGKLVVIPADQFYGDLWIHKYEKLINPVEIAVNPVAVAPVEVAVAPVEPINAASVEPINAASVEIASVEQTPRQKLTDALISLE